MNVVALSGRIARDIEYNDTNNFVKNTIAIARDMKEEDGTRTCDFINFICWKNLAEYVKKYVKKGDMVEITGRIKVGTFKTKDGGNKNSFEIVVDKLNILIKNDENKKDRPQPTKSALEVQKEITNVKLSDKEISDDDLPF